MSDKRYRVERPLYWIFSIGCGGLLLVALIQLVATWFPGIFPWIATQKVEFSHRTGIIEIVGWVVTLCLAAWGIYLTIRRTRAMENTLQHTIENSRSQQLQNALELLANENAAQRFAAISSMITINNNCKDDLRQIMLSALCRYASFRDSDEHNIKKDVEHTNFEKTLNIGTAQLLFTAIAEISRSINSPIKSPLAVIEKATIICDIRSLEFFGIDFRESFFAANIVDCAFNSCGFKNVMLAHDDDFAAVYDCEFKDCTFDDMNADRLALNGPLEPTFSLEFSHCRFKDCYFNHIKLDATLCEITGGMFNVGAKFELAECWYNKTPVGLWYTKTAPITGLDYINVGNLDVVGKHGRFLDVYSDEHYFPSSTA